MAQKICDLCHHRGATTYQNTGDGVKHYCWCTLDGSFGSLYRTCDKFELANRFKDEHRVF